MDLKNIMLYENVNSDEGTISSKESGIVTRIYEGTQNALQIDYNLGYVKTSDLKK